MSLASEYYLDELETMAENEVVMEEMSAPENAPDSEFDSEWPSEEGFYAVMDELADGADLRFEHVGRVFGPAFWMLLVQALMDSQDAARAIQGAISRLKQGETPDDSI